jgi:hypothetical protein
MSVYNQPIKFDCSIRNIQIVKFRRAHLHGHSLIHPIAPDLELSSEILQLKNAY